MTLTPVEIRHLKPSRAFVGGYDRDSVDGMLDEIVASFEDVWRERADFADKIERLEEEKKGIADDVRDVYAEAKANGYDPKIMRMIVRLRKMETHTRQEQDAILDTYRQALGLA